MVLGIFLDPGDHDLLGCPDSDALRNLLESVECRQDDGSQHRQYDRDET
jgi:hypothetical protein